MSPLSELRLDPSHTLAVSGRCDGICGKESYTDRRAARFGDAVSFRLYIPRQIGASSVSCRATSGDGEKQKTFSLTWEGLFGASDVFSLDLTGKLPIDLWFLSFSCETAIGSVYAVRRRDGGLSFSLIAPDERGTFQLTVTNFPKRNDPADGGAVYQIFVDRFRRGKETPIREGMEFVDDWYSQNVEYPAYPGAPMKNNRVWGGNLSGITEKLDEIKKLGVSLIYLSPIFLSPSNHRYDTSDYLTIDPIVGDESDLEELIAEAKKRGIGILLDGVFNHTGSDSVYFNRYGRFPSVGAYQGPASPYFNWYNFRRFPEDYECWWNIPILPRIDPDEPSCREYFVGKEGVIPHYASLGIKGFRLDVADELSDSFIRAIKTRLRENDAGSLLYGEVWEDASNKIAYDKRKRYYCGDELDGVMNYPLRTAILEYVRTGKTDALGYYVSEVMPNMPRETLGLQLNLIGTHDTPRALTALGGQPENGRAVRELSNVRMTEEEYAVARDRLILAYLMAATFPGRPMIYYGDEAGMEGYADPMNRMPYPWEREDPTLVEAYRAIGKLRLVNEALISGSFAIKHLDGSLLVYERKIGKSAVTVFINRSQSDLTVSLDSKYKDLISGRTMKGSLKLSLRSFAVLSESDT